MSLDGIAIHAITNELRRVLAGAKIDKISQSDQYTLLLSLRKPGQTLRLLGSIHPQSARLCLTEGAYQNLPEPTLFCMVLRKHLINATILSVEQNAWERIITVTCQGRNDIGDLTTTRLVCELMGKTSNILLLNDDDQILDAMRRVGAHTNTYRQIQPGLHYMLPPAQNKRPIEAITQSLLSEIVFQAPESASLEKILLQSIAGIGPQTVREIIFRAGLDPQANHVYLGEVDFVRLHTALKNLQMRIETENWEPVQVFQDQEPIAFAPFPLQQFDCFPQKSFATMSGMLETYYADKERAESFKQKRAALERVLRHETDRCEKKLGHQLDTVYAAEAADRYRLYGELITANLHQLKQGSEATVMNFYDPNQATLSIPLDASKTPNENAQRFFKRYEKARKGAVSAQVQADQTREELAYLASVQAGLEQADSFSDLAEIRRELEESGYVKRRAVRKKKQKDHVPETMHIRIQGYDCYIGKNNRQNDYVTFKIGRTGDLWLHTKDIHGAHVIIKRQGDREWPQPVIETAARCAAWFSKGRHSANVPVDVTLRKNVHKPSGAPPGKVIYTDQTTLYVTAEEAEIQALLAGPDAG